MKKSMMSCLFIIILLSIFWLMACDDEVVETNSYIRPADLSVETQQIVDVLGGHADWIFEYHFNEEKHLSLGVEYYENGELQEEKAEVEIPKVMESGKVIFNLKEGEALLSKTDHKARDEAVVSLPCQNETSRRQYMAIDEEKEELEGEIPLAALAISENEAAENRDFNDSEERQKIIEENDCVYLFKVVFH